MSFMSIFAPGVGIGIILSLVGFLANMVVKRLEKVAIKGIDNEKKTMPILCRITEIAAVPITVVICILILFAMIALCARSM